MTKGEWDIITNLPLEIKIEKSKIRIREMIDLYGVNGMYVGFSGGKDSCALLHLVRSMYPDVEAVFFNFLEFPEIQEFVKTIDNVTWLKPTMSYREIVKNFGYPFPTKIVSDYIYRYRHSAKSEEAKHRLLHGAERDDGKGTNFKIGEKWAYLLDTDLEFSEMCCEIGKIELAKSYQKESGKHPFLGITYQESGNRLRDLKEYGCNKFGKNEIISRPLGPWSEQDILKYIKEYDVPYCKEYYGDIVYERKTPRARTWLWKTTGYERSGCWACPYGVERDKEPNRFQRLKVTHPQLWEYLMKPLEEGGLGYAKLAEIGNFKME